MNIEEASIKELTMRLNEINKQIEDLRIEYNNIIYVLWKSIPTLQDDVNMQPKIRVKEILK